MADPKDEPSSTSTPGKSELEKPPTQELRPSLVVNTSVVLAATARLYGNPPEDHPIYNLIGRVASEWSHVEHLLDVIIWQLAGLSDERGACITSQMVGHGPRFFAIIALLIQRKMSKSVVDAASEIHMKCHDVAETRNRFIHDAWYVAVGDVPPEEKKPHTYKAPSRKELQKKVDELTFGLHEGDYEAKAVTTIASIRKRFTEILELKTKIRAAMDALPDKR